MKRTHFLTSVILFLILFLFVFVNNTTLAAHRFLVRDKVIIDTKTGLVWLRDANVMKKFTSRDEATTFINKMNATKYAGYDNWDFPSLREFEESFDCRRYKKGYEGMKRFYLKKYKSIGFKNVQECCYLTCSYRNTGIGGGAIFINADPTCCTGVPTITSYGYFWPVAQQSNDKLSVIPK